MKILDFFLFLWVIFALLDPDHLNADPDPATQINADPCGSGYGSVSETLVGLNCLQLKTDSRLHQLILLPPYGFLVLETSTAAAERGWGLLGFVYIISL